jgi:hypothetical protein
VDNARELAAQFLEALDRGQVPPGLRDELAVVGAALGERLRELAEEVGAGGPHAWRRAVELAELLHGLARQPDAVSESSSEKN